MAVLGYARVSTKVQADDGLSLDAQIRQLRGYAMVHGMKLDQVFTERAVSGWKPIGDRAEGRRLMGVLQEGDVLICPKLDRLFRSARDALVVSDELKERGVSLHLIDLGGDVTANGISKVFFTIIAAFAEFERDRIAERIGDVKSHQKALGRYLGGTRPFGFEVTDDNRMQPDATEQVLIEKMIYLRSQGSSLRTIADYLRKHGAAVSHVTVRRILQDVDGRNSKYAGVR